MFFRSAQESTKVTKLTFSKETKTESSESKVPESLERGRSRSRRNPIELKNPVSTGSTVPSERPVFRTVNVSIKNPVFTSQSLKTETVSLTGRSGKSEIPILTSSNVKTETPVLPDSKLKSEKPVLRETENPVSTSCYKVKIVRQEESSPVIKPVVKVGRIEKVRPLLSENRKSTFEDVEKDNIGGQSSKTTVGQEGLTYRDYLLNKKQARRPLSCDGSSAYSR